MAQINVADSGENQIVIIVGANNQLGSNDINDAWQIINNSKVSSWNIIRTTNIKHSCSSLKGVDLSVRNPY